ncbi:hypothetical protein [Clostridium sp. BL-8]|uniref:anti-sigma-I factor RsgI family protein n=1 Tax=Clostridium sp. BL-8 TaxID=349938 RepID=UPI0009D0C3D9|nr:hypothetical protein [Clostridium sp. BL-8]OOM75156.1 anti-sigma-I factor RsgI [Clostridium sp. BL-8]
MEDKLFEQLDKLDISDTDLLLKEDINLSLGIFTRRRIEKSIRKKTGYYKETNLLKDKIYNILGCIFMKKKIALALSAVIILSLGGGGYAYAKTPVAYVSLDINPSVELGVNGFDKVVSAEAYNEDGRKVLENTNLINFNINNAVSSVISNAISYGYIKEDGSSAIEVTTATDKKNIADGLGESLKETIDKTLENNDVEAEVENENVALARRDEARQLGLTPGKLNLIEKLQELDSTIKIEDYKDTSIKSIVEKTNELRKSNGNNGTSNDANLNTNVDGDGDESFDSSSTTENNEENSPNSSNDLNGSEKSNYGNDKKEENSGSNKENKNVDQIIRRKIKM